MWTPWSIGCLRVTSVTVKTLYVHWEWSHIRLFALDRQLIKAADFWRQIKTTNVYSIPTMQWQIRTSYIAIPLALIIFNTWVIGTVHYELRFSNFWGATTKFENRISYGTVTVILVLNSISASGMPRCEVRILKLEEQCTARRAGEPSTPGLPSNQIWTQPLRLPIKKYLVGNSPRNLKTSALGYEYQAYNLQNWRLTKLGYDYLKK